MLRGDPLGSRSSRPAIKQDLQYKSAWQNRRDGVYQTRSVLGTNCGIIRLAFCRHGRIGHDVAEWRWPNQTNSKKYPKSVVLVDVHAREGQKSTQSLSCIKNGRQLTNAFGWTPEGFYLFIYNQAEFLSDLPKWNKTNGTAFFFLIQMYVTYTWDVCLSHQL